MVMMYHKISQSSLGEHSSEHQSPGAKLFPSLLPSAHCLHDRSLPHQVGYTQISGS